MFFWIHYSHCFQSSAPVRSSIDQVFKYFCDDITDDGLMQMSWVFKKNLKLPGHPDSESADDDDGNDEDKDVDQAETGEIGENDEQKDDSESVVEAEEIG